ncbi:MAG: hypothetical protein ACLUNQ_01705 [Oscillospiraceae bacterium]
MRLGQSRQREVLERGTLTEDGDIRGMIFVSSVPVAPLHASSSIRRRAPMTATPASAGASTSPSTAVPRLPVSLFGQPRAGRRPPYRQILSGAGDGTGRPVAHNGKQNK